MIKHTHAQTPRAHAVGVQRQRGGGRRLSDAPLPSRSATPANTAPKRTAPSAFCIKVETHNHPTAIAPFPGASTGAGGEIRDEGATGRGGRPKAGLAGFSVSHLRIPTLPQPWEARARR